VVAVGWHWVGAALGPTAALASAPVGKGYRWCAVTLRDSFALC
jgi:hypothetical protein